ncbi:hypothetical protein EJ08DRAFT_658308 [Tothia fuscella]|uniref:RING-type domain-containing protein n=1 Tax=Tothia fuscella TaxID=1048955 RepID=A0A9P4NW56_9PEZI|nr:hypothetical protein EJ08DRAFT_658308 [Tothia fuscella]
MCDSVQIPMALPKEGQDDTATTTANNNTRTPKEKERQRAYANKPTLMDNTNFQDSEPQAKEDDDAVDDCLICQQPIGNESTRATILPCGHKDFHGKDCLWLWTGRNPTCPYCRGPTDRIQAGQHGPLFVRSQNRYVRQIPNLARVSSMFNVNRNTLATPLRTLLFAADATVAAVERYLSRFGSGPVLKINTGVLGPDLESESDDESDSEDDIAQREEDVWRDEFERAHGFRPQRIEPRDEVDGPRDTGGPIGWKAVSAAELSIILGLYENQNSRNLGGIIIVVYGRAEEGSNDDENLRDANQLTLERLHGLEPVNISDLSSNDVLNGDEGLIVGDESSNRDATTASSIHDEATIENEVTTDNEGDAKEDVDPQEDAPRNDAPADTDTKLPFTGTTYIEVLNKGGESFCRMTLHIMGGRTCIMDDERWSYGIYLAVIFFQVYFSGYKFPKVSGSGIVIANNRLSPLCSEFEDAFGIALAMITVVCIELASVNFAFQVKSSISSHIAPVWSRNLIL